MSVSLIASSVRPSLYTSFFNSLKGTFCDYEVIFCGDNNKAQEAINVYRMLGLNYKYILTKNIKPAQCYEIARRHSTKETVLWVADDCEFPNDVVGKAYKYWKSQKNEGLILSIQTKESGYGLPEGKLFDMNQHRFFGGRKDTPLMAPLALMSRKFLEDLGGFDRRYVCGQYENDVVMRAYNEGGEVEIFGDENCFIDIDHLGKSIAIGESTDQKSFRNRPFATGYQKDREVLEMSWTPLQPILSLTKHTKYVRHNEFEPYEDKDILTISQSNKGKWE